jgi:hypothetical protein
MRLKANIPQRAVAESRQFISVVMCLDTATDKPRHQPNSRKELESCLRNDTRFQLR